MPIGFVYKDNRTQVVRLPSETRFPDGVKQVMVRVVGNDRVLSPINQSWDSFFHSEQHVTDDFMPTRSSQEQSDREEF